MSGISYPVNLLSRRTAEYVSALIQQGDKFDYAGWLQQVRAEEAEAKQAQHPSTSGKIAAGKIDLPIAIPDCRKDSLSSMRLARHVAISKGMSRLNQECVGSTSAARLRRWFEEIRDAWDEFQASRARDAVYGYMEVVFAIVKHYKVRRKTNKLLRHAFKFAGLPIDKNADPFTAIIRCTSGDDVDSKTISKWARAVRYVARCKAPGTQLKASMKRIGGVNACADLYAKQCARMRSGGSRG